MQAVILKCDVTLSEGVRKAGSVVCYLEDGVTPHEARAALENLQLCSVVQVQPEEAAPAPDDESATDGKKKKPKA